MMKHCHNKHIFQRPSKKFWFGFILTGLLSLIWLIYKTGGKPSRIQYPCQKAAAANSLVFLAWLGAVLSGHLLFKRLQPYLSLGRVLVLALLVVIVFLGVKEYQVMNLEKVSAQQANQPLGTPRGYKPGRVVWVHDNTATTGIYTDYWNQVDQSVVNNMMDTSLKALTGQPSVGRSMANIFSCGASCTGRKVAIKVNVNNSNWQNSMDANSQTVKAFLRALTTAEPGVFSPFNQSDIYVYDASRWMGSNNTSGPVFTTSIKNDFPNVHLVGSWGVNGGEQIVMSTEIFSYDPTYCTPTELSSMRVPQLIKDADYIVNMPLLKEHGFWPVGGTLSFKNFLGNVNSVTGTVNGSDPRWISSGLHTCLATSGVNNPDGLVAVYTAGFNDTSSRNLGNTTLDKKVALTIGDGIFGNQNNNTGPPLNWRIFGNDSPNSLFVSQDVVAADSVMFDVLMHERQGFVTEGQQHLEAAAQRPAGSLGVHEHPNKTGKCSNQNDLSCWNYSGPQVLGVDFVNCDAQSSEDPRCNPASSSGASFSLQTDKSAYTITEEIPVKVLMQSDTDEANLFSAQLNFTPSQLEVVGVEIVGSFVTLWADNSYDNTAGTVSLVGSVPNPGFKTSGSTALMGTVIFRAKVAGSGSINFDASSQILRNSDNANILSSASGISLSVTDAPTSTPIPPTPTPVPTCGLEANSALWSATSTPENTQVSLTVKGTNSSCIGQSVEFNIRRNISVGFDEDITKLTASFNDQLTSTTTWTTPTWFDSCGGIDPRTCDPIYHFDATVGTQSQRSNDLVVTDYTPTASTDWPQVAKDPQHTGYSSEVLGTNFQVDWTYPFQPDRVYPQTQAIIYQGKVFVGTEGANGQKPRMIALYAGSKAQDQRAGTVAWEFPADGPILNSAAADNGLVYFATLNGSVYALDMDGKEVWRSKLIDRLGFSTAPIIADNMILIGGQDGNFYALNPSDGQAIWRYKAASPILMTAAFNQGRVFFGTQDMYFYALNISDSTLAWKSPKLGGIAMKDYWPLVAQGKVIVRPWADNGDSGTKSSTFIVLDEETGTLDTSLGGGDGNTMNGATPPHCVYPDGKLVVPAGVIGGTWQAGWGILDMVTNTVETISFLTGNGAGGYGNSDENDTATCSQNLIIFYHAWEASATFNGFYDLKNKTWTSASYGHYDNHMSSNTQGGGANPVSISNSMIYHIAWHELVVRTTN